MAKTYPLAAGIVLLSMLLFSCSKEEYAAQEPVYFSIPGIGVTTEYSEQGTSHSKITTVWVYVNGEHSGAYEMPCTVPLILEEGTNDIRLYPGIHLNGSSSSRAIYEFYDPIDFQYEFSPSGTAAADTFLVPNNDTAKYRTTQYTLFSQVSIVEDFDEVGLNLEKTSQATIGITTTSDPSEVFTNPQNPSENNKKAGVLRTTAPGDIAEVASVKTYNLPRQGANVYVELNYKTNIPFLVGVIANYPTGNVQQVTARVNPAENWNKIYINLVTELTGLSGADNFKIFIGAEHANSVDTGEVFLDNIKLVY